MLLYLSYKEFMTAMSSLWILCFIIIESLLSFWLYLMLSLFPYPPNSASSGVKLRLIFFPLHLAGTSVPSFIFNFFDTIFRGYFSCNRCTYPIDIYRYDLVLYHIL